MGRKWENIYLQPVPLSVCLFLHVFLKLLPIKTLTNFELLKYISSFNKYFIIFLLKMESAEIFQLKGREDNFFLQENDEDSLSSRIKDKTKTGKVSCKDGD